MSLKTWKKEFYKTKPSKRMSQRTAIEHSILKWTGLLPKNMSKHELSKWSFFIEDDKESFEIDVSSCALCVKYLGKKKSHELDACAACPLAQHLGSPCDVDEKPYLAWRRTGNPRPMIKALKALLEDK